jgi:hypothetical protein
MVNPITLPVEVHVNELTEKICFVINVDDGAEEAMFVVKGLTLSAAELIWGFYIDRLERLGHRVVGGVSIVREDAGG